MNVTELINTAQQLVGAGKGLLAMDESIGTCNKRFAEAGIPQTEEARRSYRELIVTTPGLGQALSGAILYDETIRQRKGQPVALRHEGASWRRQQREDHSHRRGHTCQCA